LQIAADSGSKPGEGKVEFAFSKVLIIPQGFAGLRMKIPTEARVRSSVPIPFLKERSWRTLKNFPSAKGWRAIW